MADDVAKISEIASDPEYKKLVEERGSVVRVRNNNPTELSEWQLVLAEAKLEADVKAVAKAHNVDLGEENARKVREGLMAQLPMIDRQQAPDQKDIDAAIKVSTEAQSDYNKKHVDAILNDYNYQAIEEKLGAAGRVHNAGGMTDEQFGWVTATLNKNLTDLTTDHSADVRRPEFAQVRAALKAHLENSQSFAQPPSAEDIKLANRLVEAEEKSHEPSGSYTSKPNDVANMHEILANPRFQKVAASLQSIQRLMQPAGAAQTEEGSKAALEAKVQLVMEKAFGMDANPGAAEKIRTALKNSSNSGEDVSHVPNGGDWQAALGALKQYNESHPGNEGAIMNVADVRTPGTGHSMSMAT